MSDNKSDDASPRDVSARPAREGFALPMAIMVIAFLTVTIAAAYAATSSELTTNTAQRGESRAYMLAQAGLENFIARRNEVGFCARCGNPPITTYESTTVTLPGGYAQVVALRLRGGSRTKSAIYLLRSTGVDTVSVVTGSSVGSYAQRTVAQIVYWNVNQVNVLSGWTSTSGLDKQGSSGTISGVDTCPAAQGGGAPTVAGIAVPNGDYSSTGNFTPVGNPPVQQLGTQDQADSLVKVDWDGIINGDRVQPDYTFATNAAATAGWPTAQWAADTNYYPVIRVNDNFTLPTSGGRGTLIVMGNLTMSGSNLWHGIILVGGQMTSNGNGTVNGAVESGLNTLLSKTTASGTIDSSALVRARSLTSATLARQPAAATANGTKTFQYNSCDVARAAGGLASYSVFPNAWMDNFVTY